MRIGFFNPSAGTRHAGGIAVYIQQLAVELSRSNDVYLYTRGGDLSELLVQSDVTVVETPSFNERLLSAVHHWTPFSSEDWATAAMAVWGLRNGLFDHVDEHVDLLLTFTWIDDLVASNLVDVPTIYGFHSLTGAGVFGRVRHHLSDAEWTIANADDTARRVHEVFGYEVDEVIYPGVDPDCFRPDVEPAFSSDVPVVLYVGRLFEQKGIYDLLEAFARLDEPAALHVVGYGETARVRRRCRELGIADAVTLHGERPHLELPGYYAAADVFCLPSHAESFGMVNVEAMACATPVVTSDLEGIRAYLTDEAHGLLVQPGDTVELAHALETLVGSPDRRRTFGEQAREAARQFTWEHQARRLEAFCADVLDASLDDREQERPTSEHDDVSDPRKPAETVR